ncbi:MAG: NUDIX domain-containing protein [Microbacterium sp.]|uniref:NUDIX domain-containing protein n=1 Tax=Microbacterium sp. TaxID=51671 RepID=UPI001AD169E3|nr:NUDIX domain-containing protein [Microbacterium sp.]MBN9214705.1 NUDIX domain-containing protein [Microbacterium sp.]
MDYVAGFLIDPTARTVALVRKRKPEWQRGKLNGIGGKVELGETPHEAMQREFWEEAGLNIRSWDHFATVEGAWGQVHFFRAFNEATPRTMESEPIEVHRLDAVPYSECIPNLSWLIPLALYTHDMYVPVVATELGTEAMAPE